MGVDYLANMIDGIYADRISTGLLESLREKRRLSSMIDWVRMDFNNKMNLFTSDVAYSASISDIFDKVGTGQINPRAGSKLILDAMVRSDLDI